MRASLHRGCTLEARAPADSFEDNRKASDERKWIPDEAPDFEWSGADWDHAAARWLFRHSDATNEAYTFDEDRLLVAATLVAAEFEVSRSFDSRVVEAYIFLVLTAANSQIASLRRGRLPGLISLIDSAATHNEA